MAGQTIFELMAGGAADAPALAAPERDALDYAGLRDHIAQTVTALNAAGIGRGDLVAIVLPNGPEMASAFVAIACAATTAPLNPAYRQEEFEFYLSDLKAKVLVVQQDAETPARAAAQKLDIPILQINYSQQQSAGVFTFGAAAMGTPVSTGLPAADDVALVLHTSGTTSRPKIVPLTHRNVTASAKNICATLKLTPEDRCLNMMPLFHIHGLIAAILASLGAGGGTYCCPGFNALKFFGWLDDAAPSWYTAVPTMHQALLARAKRSREVIERNQLRFVRSSSASLPSQVMAELEQAFNAPVIEAYAMTEAAHQMTSNPLPPKERKPGTVGVAAGPEVAVMDAVGALLAAGETGEVVIRGANVTAGYESNPKANAEAFTNGWFRTGDQGVMDEQGYLRITGRLKEIINRGGEKISPREVDDVLMDHPAVQQVVTFAKPHEKLGEDVVAAVVLVEGQQASEREIRDFVSEHLADFKVPRQIVFLDEIPKGPTGKLQRIGLAEKLGLV